MRAAPAALLAITLVVAGCSGSDDPPAADASSAGASPAVPGLTVTQLDTGPVGVADVDGSAWTVLLDDGSVRTADDERIDVGEAPLRLVDTPAGVWVSVIGDGTIVNIDPETGEVRQTVALKPAGSEPEGMAWDGERLWVVDQAHDRVVALDVDGSDPREFAVEEEPRLVSAGDSGIWVTNYAGASVSRVVDNQVRSAQLTGCSGPQGVAEAGGKVWIACTLSSKVIALDAGTLEQVAEIPGITDADAVVATEDTVYAVGQVGPTVWVIDAASGDVEDTIVLDEAMATNENVGAAIVGDDLVVTHPEEQRIYSLPLP